MPKNSSGKNKKSQKTGNQNGSSAGTDVPAEGALVANFPPVSAGGEDLAQDDAVANFPPAPAGGDDSSQVVPAVPVVHIAAKLNDPNFKGGDAKPPPEESVDPDHLAVSRIFASLISLKPFFSA